MKSPRAQARCYRCPALYVAHAKDGTCPDGGGTYARRPGWRPGMSFDEHEVAWLSDVLTAVEQRKPLSALASTPELASMARKVLSLRRAAERAQGDRVRAKQRPRAQQRCKLDAQAVRAIRAASKAGMRQADIAAHYGVSVSAIDRVLRRETWAHVE